MERSIDELLSGEPAEPTVEAAPQETEETPQETEAQAEERLRDEKGRFAAKQTGVEEEPVAQQPQEPDAGPPPADQLPKDVYEPLKAVRNENRELKQQIEALNQRFAAMQQQPAPPEAPPQFWDDPDRAIEARVNQAAEMAVQRFQQQQIMERINESETRAKATYDDYGEAFAAFQQAVSANPALIQQMTSSSDPAEFAYKKGKTALELQQVGSIDALLANERAKWEQEAKARMPAPPTLPSTTATDGSVGGRSGPAWAGPPSIEQMLR